MNVKTVEPPKKQGSITSLAEQTPTDEPEISKQQFAKSSELITSQRCLSEPMVRGSLRTCTGKKNYSKYSHSASTVTPPPHRGKITTLPVYLKPVYLKPINPASRIGPVNGTDPAKVPSTVKMTR